MSGPERQTDGGLGLDDFVGAVDDLCDELAAARPYLERITVVLERLAPLAEKIGPLLDKAGSGLSIMGMLGKLKGTGRGGE